MANLNDRRGKICIVTGANSGIGRATALRLARMGATVVMVCRDRAKGEAAQAEIWRESGNDAMDLLIADLSSLAAVRGLAETIKAKYPRIEVLINNAAVVKRKRVVTADGLEMMFATNHLAPFLLTNLLLEVLRASGSARVLNVTAPSTVNLDFDDLQGERHFRALYAFGASKMANLLFTFELARRPEGAGIDVNAIHPGLARSNLMREANPVMRFVTKLVSKAPEHAASGLVRVATAPEFAGQSGQFYHNGKAITADAYAYDQTAQRKLWEVSAKLTGVSN